MALPPSTNPARPRHALLLVPESSRSSVRVHGPASLSNLGPGFDAVGLCIGGFGDVVEGRWRETPGVQVTVEGGAVPADPDRNTAACAAAAVLRRAGVERGLHLHVQKGIPLGSGIGGSSASAVAGAWAANLLLGEPFRRSELVEAVLDGEAATGARHGDNVLPALLGGLVLVDPSDPARYRRIVLPRPLHVALLLPDLAVLTEEARRLLPRSVPLPDAVANAADLAFLVDAFRAGDWETVGRQIMRDRLVEPVRARLVPCYDAVRRAALEAGAYGCALTGSGPAMFAPAETHAAARTVASAMEAACRAASIEATAHATHADERGVRRQDEGMNDAA
ncbi:MAG: homoserine kinase [Rhodothermales bacterium]|nr:homoserine kinase [Rhodothermales bacterium]